MEYNEVKDSGVREEFTTGSLRDTSIGKGRYELLPFYAIHRLARVYENGAVKYGENNWRLGQPLSRYLNSALRHLMKAGAGWVDEDHFGQAMWNICSIIETQKMIELGKLPKTLDDLTAFTPEWEEGNKKEEVKTTAINLPEDVLDQIANSFNCKETLKNKPKIQIS